MDKFMQMHYILVELVEIVVYRHIVNSTGLTCTSINTQNNNINAGTRTITSGTLTLPSGDFQT